MSNYVEIPERPPQQPWPGLGTRVGFLDPGVGFLEDGSVNMMINRGDLLEKRKGFTRGLDEYFNGPVCGLFKYTSTCGIEYLLVADQAGINIRQPFAVPVFESSDAYPFDSFSIDGFPSSYYWRNTERYVASDDELHMRAGVDQVTDPIASADFMRWFKDAANLSYQVRIEYAFDTVVTTEQQISVLIKGNGDLTTGAYLVAQLKFDGSGFTMDLCHFNGTSMQMLDSVGVTGSITNPTGFLTLAYARNVATGTFTASVTVLPSGGAQTVIDGSLNVLEDTSLGQTSAIAIGHNGGTQPDPTILVVDGGPL